MHRWLIVGVLFATFAVAGPGVEAAARRPGGPLDLAAMALAPDHVPVGLFDDYGELLVPAAEISDLVL